MTQKNMLSDPENRASDLSPCKPTASLFHRVLGSWGRSPLAGMFPARESIMSVFKVITGTFATSVISLVTSIFVARWTTPYDLGVWNAALLVTVYTPTLQLGVFNGLNRELPYFLGAGDKTKAQSMAESAYAWSLLLTAASVVLTGAAAAWFEYHHQRVLCYTAMAVGANVVCYWMTGYLTTTYRTHAEFGRLAQNTVMVAIVGAALLPLVWLFRYEGILLKASLISMLGVCALYFRRPMPVRPRWDYFTISHLARVGIPIWVAGQVASFFVSLDRLVLVKSPQLLGYFTVAIQVAAFARAIPIAFTMVLYPQMAHKYGETHNAMDIWHIAKLGAIGACFFGFVAGCCGWLLVPHAVRCCCQNIYQESHLPSGCHSWDWPWASTSSIMCTS